MFDNLSDGPVERYLAAIEGAAMAGLGRVEPRGDPGCHDA